jgi:hypothetical protein
MRNATLERSNDPAAERRQSVATGASPWETVFSGTQPRQGRKIRRENLTLLRSWELRFTSTPRLRVGLNSIAAPRLDH